MSSSTTVSQNLGIANSIHFIFNIDQFELTKKITCDQYANVVNSNKVPLQKLVPDTHLTLNCDFVRQGNIRNKKFHNSCVIETEQVPVRWSTFQLKHCHGLYEVAGNLLFNRDNWWCWFCARPLFILPSCIRSQQQWDSLL